MGEGGEGGPAGGIRGGPAHGPGVEPRELDKPKALGPRAPPPPNPHDKAGGVKVRKGIRGDRSAPIPASRCCGRGSLGRSASARVVGWNHRGNILGRSLGGTWGIELGARRRREQMS